MVAGPTSTRRDGLAGSHGATAPASGAQPSPVLAKIALGLAAGLLAGWGCATSDQVLAAQQELEQVQAKRGKPAECKPGVDEPCYAGAEGTAGRGLCHEGIRKCSPEGFWGACNGEVRPVTESCNGKDDDCDGIIDNDFERQGALCFRSQGACRTQGTWKCAADGAKSECNAAIVAPTEEICDNIDNDCNGEIDDGSVKGAGDACNTGKPGACNAGSKRCVGGAIRCVQNQPPGVEICNGIDDDCDNQVDDDCVKKEAAG
jgi:hypothetical protein